MEEFNPERPHEMRVKGSSLAKKGHPLAQKEKPDFFSGIHSDGGSVHVLPEAELWGPVFMFAVLGWALLRKTHTVQCGNSLKLHQLMQLPCPHIFLLTWL